MEFSFLLVLFKLAQHILETRHIYGSLNIYKYTQSNKKGNHMNTLEEDNALLLVLQNDIIKLR
jgi:hypothetical protein